MEELCRPPAAIEGSVEGKVQFSSVPQSCRLLCDPMNRAARQDSLSITNSRSSLRLTAIESVMPSSHLILCRPPIDSLKFLRGFAIPSKA